VFTTWSDAVASVPSAEQDAAFTAAQEYNADLLAGRINPSTAEAEQRYVQTLATPGTDVMAWLTVPALDVSLPVYHGTTDAVLANGVGHWYGSTLPVGGEGHAVLSAHSGLSQATLFTHLERLVVGDRFAVSAQGRVMHYEVDDIAVVRPEEVDGVRPEPGKDYVTLVTCTPTGANTYRLLVRGVRVDAPDAAQAQELTHVSPDAGFPVWAAIWGGSAVGALVLSWTVLTPPKRRGEGPPDDRLG
jgi:sortase A